MLVLQALLMVYESSESLKDRFTLAREALIEMFPGARRPGETYQGFIKAQNRVPVQAQETLREHLRGHHRRVAGPRWQRNGWVPIACDGSRVELPRTAANERAFGCAGRSKTTPQLFVTTLYHLGTGLPWDWRIGAGTESERDHLRMMLASLPPGALIVADAGFTGYDLMQEILARGLSFLIRVGSNVTLLTELGIAIKSEPDGVWLWPQAKQNDHRPLHLRLIRVPGREIGAKEGMYLLTNVFDRRRLSNALAVEFYGLRWGVEVFYRSYKQTLEQRKLRSDAPETAQWELFWGMTALLLLGLMSVGPAVLRGDDPLKLSVAEGLRIIRRAMRTSACWRRRGDLRTLLGSARHDGYERRADKKARDWPHKKNEQPPGTPKLRPATKAENLRAQRINEAA
jgi:hypothetical protein